MIFEVIQFDVELSQIWIAALARNFADNQC